MFSIHKFIRFHSELVKNKTKLTSNSFKCLKWQRIGTRVI